MISPPPSPPPPSVQHFDFCFNIHGVERQVLLWLRFSPLSDTEIDHRAEI